MKILVAAYDCIPGAGSEPGLGWQFVSLAAREHDVWALTKESNRSAIESDPRAAHINWEFIDVPEKLGPIETGGSGGDVVHILRWFGPAMERAEELHAEVGFDLTHYISFGAYWIPEPFSLLGVPHLFGPVTGGEDMPEGFRDGAGVVSKAAYVARRGMQNGLMRRKAWRSMAASPKTLMIAATTATRARMLGAGATNVEVFRPSFALETAELDELEPMGAPHEPGPASFVMSGRLIGWKGHALGLEAFARAVSEQPDVHLHLIGSGPEEPNLLTSIDELDIADNVTWHGSLDRAAERAIIASSDVFVLPSLRDAGSTLLVYAMALGRPIVSFETGAIAEMTADASLRAPVTTKAEAVAALGDIMVSVARDPERRTTMGDYGRARARELFSRESVHESLTGWYERLAELR